MTGPSRRAALLIALGAALLTTSYPPFRLPVVSFLAVAPAILLLRELEREGDARRALRLGFWYGFATQGLVLYWLVVALWHFTPLSALGYLATIAIYGLWTAGLFWLVVRVRARFPMLPLWVVFPLVWTAVEWGIAHQGDIRFPWLGLGTSLADLPILIQWADVAGARGVTLWLAWCNVMLVDALPAPRERGAGTGSLRWRRLAALLATVVLAWGYGAWRMKTLPVRDAGVVGLVQPNEGFREKWDRARQDSVMANLLDLSHRLADSTRIDLLIWPEAAVPDYFVRRPDWDPALAQRARATRTPLLTGGLDAEFYSGGAYEYYNAAFFYDASGDRSAYPVYHKHYLVGACLPARRRPLPRQHHERRLVRPHGRPVPARVPPRVAGDRDPHGNRPRSEFGDLRNRRSAGAVSRLHPPRGARGGSEQAAHERRDDPLYASGRLGGDAGGASDVGVRGRTSDAAMEIGAPGVKLRIGDCGLRIVRVGVEPHDPALQIRNPQSAIRNWAVGRGRGRRCG